MLDARVPMVIDGGTTSGYGVAIPGRPKPLIGIFEMPDTDHIGRFCNAMADILIPFCALNGVTEVHVEAPIIAKHKRAGEQPCPTCGQTKSDLNAHAVDRLFGIVHAVEMAADKMGMRKPARIARGTVCKHVAGVGRGTSKQFKTMCLLACQRKGFNITSEDVADAVCALDYWTWIERIPVGWNNQPAPGPLFDTPGGGVRIDKGNEVRAAVLVNKVLSFNRGEG